MAMVRKQIYLSADADRRIKSEAKLRRVSQAALIREKLEPEKSAGARPRVASPEDARTEALAALRRLRRATPDGAGTGRKFRREDAYADRLDRIDPPGHKRSRLRG